ncbi:hypothetical protein HZC09_06545 [Candidatus Micrarchaeota archaeon]|nr:hypothetical protein [Candidatus Micrarchaeota archaeon]
MKEYRARSITRAKIDYSTILGRGFDGIVHPCELTFKDGLTEMAAVKIVKEGDLFSKPKEVHDWNKTMSELRTDNLPVPEWSGSRIVTREGKKEGHFFMPLLDKTRLKEVGTNVGQFIKIEPTGLARLNANEHAHIAQAMGTDLATLHNAYRAPLAIDFWHYVTDDEGRIVTRLILDVGGLKTRKKLFEHFAKKNLIECIDNLANKRVVKLFLDAYANAVKHENMKELAQKELKKYGDTMHFMRRLFRAMPADEF